MFSLAVLQVPFGKAAMNKHCCRLLICVREPWSWSLRCWIQDGFLDTCRLLETYASTALETRGPNGTLNVRH
ncbi:hypothetical protein Y1Q_0016821 [Alligator mississippiensis]|uniref:Uncharacterized protein n=1 Tax=Alligator mississippiensis TaxID=8496 RepID=A0A151P6Q8_ALLMI|nr:hypothetical protein Y1Q_0016821 [Alligator mississippiensis]